MKVHSTPFDRYRRFRAEAHLLGRFLVLTAGPPVEPLPANMSGRQVISAPAWAPASMFLSVAWGGHLRCSLFPQRIATSMSPPPSPTAASGLLKLRAFWRDGDGTRLQFVVPKAHGGSGARRDRRAHRKQIGKSGAN